jgi:hypothetical protein
MASMNGLYAQQERAAREQKAFLNMRVEFVVTVYGEIIPFNQIARLSLNQFNDIDGMADALGSTVTLPVNHLFAELSNGQRCILDLDNLDFMNSINQNEYSIYFSNDQVKNFVIKSFVRNYETSKENIKRSNFNQATIEPAV